MQAMLTRVAFAVALVLLTWNPSKWSYVEWALRDRSTFDAVKAFCGVLLATIVWMLVQFGLVQAGTTQAFVWIVLIAVGVALGVGLSWSKVRQRATGQVEVD